MSAPGQVTIIRKRRKHRRRTSLLPLFLIVLATAGAIAGGIWIYRLHPFEHRVQMPEGYVGDIAALRHEFDFYYGNETDFGPAAARFETAAELAGKRNFAGVASVLETATKAGGLPVLFHDLGVAYAELGDRSRAADCFREALARDPEYAATRKYLRDFHGIPRGAADPHTREQEPNNTPNTGTLIALRTPVSGEIAGSSDSADCYKFIAPRAPRDLVAIEVANRSEAFSPRLHIYDEHLKILSWGEKWAHPGETIRVIGGPAPNTAAHVSISTDDGEGGMYVLSITPQKAYDRYEPNDDIMAARRISVAEEVSANIMDNADVDFFAFVSPRSGPVTIEVRNRSTTLLPALAVYNADRRHLGGAQDGRKPGADLRHTVQAEKDQIYYLQVSSQDGSSGAYVLRVD